MRRVVVGVTGASGSVLALEVLRQLRSAGAETHLVVSARAPAAIEHELGGDGLARMVSLASAVHDEADMTAPVASGSFRTEAMAIVPCSMRTLAAVAHGFGDSLLTRAADVALKERRRLVLVPRECPLHERHLENMLVLARMGATVAPPMPPFYARPATIDDLVREIAARVVGWLGFDPGDAITRWKETEVDPAFRTGGDAGRATRESPTAGS